MRPVGIGGCGHLRHNDDAHAKARFASLGMRVNLRPSMFLFRSLHHAATRPLRICTNCLRNASTQSTSTARGGKKQVIFSGIQPTGIPHLGNYFGALQQWVKIQNEAPADTVLLFSIVDLHAITIKQDPSELAKRRKEMLASLLAVGLDSKRCILFAQSSVKQHAELMWILSCGASMGYLGRMTQWKVWYRPSNRRYVLGVRH